MRFLSQSSADNCRECLPIVIIKKSERSCDLRSDVRYGSLLSVRFVAEVTPRRRFSKPEVAMHGRVHGVGQIMVGHLKSIL